MKILNFKMFEAVISPDDFTDFTKALLMPYGSVDELNKAVEQYDTIFVNYDTFYAEYLDTEVSKNNAPPKGITIGHGGFCFALYSTAKDKYVFVFGDKFYKGKVSFDSNLAGFISMVLGHESIHRKQNKLSNGKAYSLNNSPTKPHDYFNHYSEVMAYAYSHAWESKNMDKLSKEKALKKGSKHARFIAPFLTDQNRKRFDKYYAQYIDMLYDNE